MLHYPNCLSRKVTLTGKAALLAGLLLMCAASSEAQPAVRQVLLLQSVDRGNLIIDHFTGNFRVDLDERAERPLNVVQFVVGPTGAVGAPEESIVDFIRSTYANRPQPDLIVAVAGPATVFARKYRQQLFPETPLLFAAVDQRYLGDAPLDDNDTAVAVVLDFPRLVDGILQLLPQTKQVFVVNGSGLVGQFWHRALEEEFRQFRDRMTFVWSDEMFLPEVLRRGASLPTHSAILYITFGTDATGAAYADERVLAALHATANAPVFGAQSVYLGYGIVGGALMSIDDLSRNTADVAIRLLNGAPPRSVRVPLQAPGQPMFDFRELQRWGIAESRLPTGSVVRYRSQTLWSEYRVTVLSALGALMIQSLLIIGLLYHRRERQRAELDSLKNLALAADASRRETMSALTSSIAHDLSQPLTAMTVNALALRNIVTTNTVTSDTIGEIVSDIQAQGLRAGAILDRHRTMLRSHPLDKKPIDIHAVTHETLALVANDMRARHIRAIVILPSSPCVVSGDHVLLQQVLLNLVINAMDAMAETPPARRHVTIKSEVRADDVELSVRDVGTGLPEHMTDTVFAPFVTTKSNGIGIGLTIARTIIDAHGGTIAAYNNPDGGATFTVTLRRSERLKILSRPGAALSSLVGVPPP